MHGSAGSCSSFAHESSFAGVRRRCLSAATSIAIVGAIRYTHSAVHCAAARSAANVRAGFMLVPESGDSSVMNTATSAATSAPVCAANRWLDIAVRIVVMSRNEMMNSAANAADTPGAPGIVTT